MLREIIYSLHYPKSCFVQIMKVIMKSQFYSIFTTSVIKTMYIYIYIYNNYLHEVAIILVKLSNKVLQYTGLKGLLIYVYINL